MDAVTQIQSYLRTIAATYSSTLQYMHDGSPSVPIDHLEYPTEGLVERAEQLFKLLVETDLLMAALPQDLSGEQEQLRLVERLNEENVEAGIDLDEVKKQADIWRKRLSLAVEHVSKVHLSNVSSLHSDKDSDSI